MSKKITNKNRNLFEFGGQTIDPMKFSNQYIRPNTGFDMNSINASASKTLNGMGSTPINGSAGLNISPYLGAAQGAFQLGSQFASNMDTSGIGNEVVGTNDMSRSDILNTQVDVNSNKSNTLGQAASGAMTGAQAGMCVCAGTLLYLQDGSQMEVEKLMYGDAVIGWKDNSAQIQRIYHFHRPTEKNCYEITTEKGFSIRCSHDHPILWSKSGLVKRKIGMRHLGTRQKRFEFKDAGKISTGEQIAIIREVPFFGNLKLENARLIGMLIGDGYYGKSKSVSFATKDIELKDFVSKYNIKEESNSSESFFRCIILDIANQLVKIGIRNQTKENKRLPLNTDKMDEDSICELIGGLFDTDGCVSVDGSRIRVLLSQSNIELLKQVQNLLIKIGVVSNISLCSKGSLKKFPNEKKYLTRDNYNLDISDAVSVYNFAKKIKLLINRKQSNLNKVFESNVNSKYSDDYGVLFDRVKTVSNIGNQLVYNIAVDDSHTYIANNIVTHNSFGPVGAAIGAGVGLISGGLSSILGNSDKQRKADEAENLWRSNLNAKNRQFQQQDLRQSMANFNALGGNINTGYSIPDVFVSANRIYKDRFEDSPSIKEMYYKGKRYTGTKDELNKILKGKKPDIGGEFETINPLYFDKIKGDTIPHNEFLNRYRDMKSPQTNQSFAFGGNMYAYGGNEQSPLVEFNSGGTHEQNINGGIMQGTGQNGKPNLVEEGETKHDDYIYSDRLVISPEISKEFKLPSNLNGKTFAEASKYLNRETKDRPNDPINKNAIKVYMSKLTTAQDGLKSQIQPQEIQPEGQENILEQGTEYSEGGKIHIKPSKVGTFTAAATKHGKSVQGFASQVLTNKENYSPAMVKKANFAKNASKWHAYGGDLFLNSGQSIYQNPTLQGANIDAYGGNLYWDGDFLDFQNKNKSNVLIDTKYQSPYIQQPTAILNAASPTGSAGAKYIQEQNLLGNKVAGQELYANTNLQPTIQTTNDYGFNLQNALLKSKNAISGLSKNINTNDKLRYAPVGANIAMGISDIFQRPEVESYGRISPELITAREDYSPIDTEWMTNKMNSTYAGLRDQLTNSSGGARSAAMSGLLGTNQQQQNAIGESYLKAQDINYNRRTSANRFNADIEAKNVELKNAAQQQNLALRNAEADVNARNRAAKRNAARNAILQAAQDLGGIGKENYFAKTAENVYGYNKYGDFVTQDGRRYDKTGKLIQ